MVTVYCTVGRMKNAFNDNAIKKIELTSSVSLQHCVRYRLQYSVCVTSVPHQQSINPYQIITHRLEEGTESVL
jgi:hypothetical protein